MKNINELIEVFSNLKDNNELSFKINEFLLDLKKFNEESYYSLKELSDLGKRLISGRLVLNKLLTKRFYTDQIPFDEMIYLQAEISIIEMNKIPSNLNDTFLNNYNDIHKYFYGTNSYDIKDGFILKMKTYDIFDKIYNKNGYDGIAKFIMLNNKLKNEYKNNNLITLLYNKESLNNKAESSFLDNVIVNLTSNESILGEYDTNSQVKLIGELFSKNGKRLIISNYDDRFITSKPEFNLDNNTIDLVNELNKTKIKYLKRDKIML